MEAIDIQNCNFLIVGAGKVGISIAEYLKTAGVNLRIYTRNYLNNLYIQSSQILSHKDCISSIDSQLYTPDIIFICVNDNSIAEIAFQLVSAFNDSIKNMKIIHCSGILGSDELNACRIKGAYTASMHPYQTFYKPNFELLEGIGWGIETESNPEFFIDLANFLNGNYHILTSKEEKIKYHLSAVMASNFLNSLLSGVIDIHKDLGLDFEKFALPIIKQTLDNSVNFSKDTGEMPLTGPIARADKDTIVKHLKSIEGNPEITKLYKYFALATLESAKNKGIIDSNQYKEFLDLIRL